jgi:tetratricopeptide (TPR) repeat protein
VNESAKVALQVAAQAEAAGLVDDALAAFDHACSSSPDDPAVWSARGLFLGRLGRFADAVTAFRRSTSIKPTYCDHYNTGNMLHALGRNDEAFVEYDAALAVEPNHAEGWCNRGIVLYAQGQIDEARTSFDRAINLDDKLVNALHCKALLLQKTGDKSAAVAARRKITELAPSAAAFIDLANALRDGLGPQILWEPKGIEEQIVDACEAALALPCDPKQHVWCAAERLMRLQRIAHGRQSARHAGIAIEDGPAILRYLAAAEQSFERYPDKWFEDKLSDAQLLKASLPL